MEVPFKRTDEYDLAWVRDALNVTRVEVGQWKTMVIQLCDRLEIAEKSLHETRLQRQQDMVKLGSLTIERDDLKKTADDLRDRVEVLEKSMDNAREYIKGLRKNEGK